jgi:hypothetical protein
MDTTKIIKILVVLEVLLLLAYLGLSFSLESHLPAVLQQYLNQELESGLSTSDQVALWGGIPVLLCYVASVVGLLLTKAWGKGLYILTAMAGYLLAPFLSPTIEHAASATVCDLGSVTEGAILALLFFTKSAFNKSSDSDGASTADY